MLVVLDGWGWREETADNAVRLASTPTFNQLWATGPHALLHTSGQRCRPAAGQMGNSEVGHLNIGAGRVVMQDLPRIGDAIAAGEIEAGAGADRLDRAALKKSGGTCHLIGLVSPGGVHSHQDHAAALAQILAEAGVPTVVHAFTDGRDTPPRSAARRSRRDSTRRCRRSVPIATVGGRYYAMDRDKRWERVGRPTTPSWRPTARASPIRRPPSPTPMPRSSSTNSSCRRSIGDYRGMRDGDGVLCFNFRADRVREILGACSIRTSPALRASARSSSPRRSA